MDPSKNDPDQPDNHHLLPGNGNRTIQPLPGQTGKEDETNNAADLIRRKLDKLYAKEPAAKEEIAEAESVTHRSKHQEFMHNLSHSGKSLAEIQTEWHAYYSALPNNEKHQVWQEFYASHDAQQNNSAPATAQAAETAGRTATHETAGEKQKEARTVNEIKKQLLGSVQKRGRAQAKSSNLKSLLFGLGMGTLVIVVFLFSFFNERFIAPFITPSRNVSAESIIIDPANTAVGPEPKIIIPKINVEIPIDFTQKSISEEVIHNALDSGVVWYPTTSAPGEVGNGVIFGHSANNIFNKGKYKFAFVLLKRLEAGDTFYVQKDGKRYVYKVFDKKVVAPTEVSVLYPTFPDKPSTFTLITCDPPGTSLNRLVVTAEQISPNPSSNTASHATSKNQPVPKELPSNSITLWQRIKNWF